MDDFEVGCSQNGGHGTYSANAESLMNFVWFNHGLTIPIISTQNQIVHDLIEVVLIALVALAALRFWDEMAKRDVFDRVFFFSHQIIVLFFSFFRFLWVDGNRTCDPSLEPGFRRIELKRFFPHRPFCIEQQQLK